MLVYAKFEFSSKYYFLFNIIASGTTISFIIRFTFILIFLDVTFAIAPPRKRLKPMDVVPTKLNIQLILRF